MADIGDLLEKTFLLGLGAASWTKEKIEKAVKDLVEKGELSTGEGKKLAQDLIERGKKDRETLKKLVQDQVKKGLDVSQIATKEDLKKLEAEINKLKAALAKKR